MPDAEKAVTYFGPAFSNTPELVAHKDRIEIKTYALSSYGLIKTDIELHLLGNKTGHDSVLVMKEIGENLFACAINFNKSIRQFQFRFEAEDIRGYRTIYPGGILGKYFFCCKSEGKYEILIR